MKEVAVSHDLPHQSRFANQDGVTIDQRDQPPGERAAIVELEHASVTPKPDQLSLFSTTPEGQFGPGVAELEPLAPESGLDLARTWYRRHLELRNRPQNTIESYSYDLQILEKLIGPKRLIKIDRRDIAKYLGDASNKTTRKRRLTSARRFFRYLIDDAGVLSFDPTDGYFPHSIQLRTPVPLSLEEQDGLLGAAQVDEPWSASAIWLMMRLGLTRAELLALKRDHIDRTDLDRPVVAIVYDDLSRQSKERHLVGDAIFSELLTAFIDQVDPPSILYPVGPPAVNGMVGRVAKAAGIEHEVTPQTLRHTFAVEQARAGADRQELLTLLGLADDARNRASVDRYIKLVAEPLSPVTQPLREQETS
jgi:integrase/recombinase XerD